MRRCSSGGCSQGSPGERLSVEGWSSGRCVGHGLHGSVAGMSSGLGGWVLCSLSGRCLDRFFQTNTSRVLICSVPSDVS